jgi:HD superfamily phosphohydrolase
MSKVVQEIRDPVHQFINFSPHEKTVIDSAPVQRLRSIHQLAMTYLVYPGATHRRFEHSLGTMELASRVYAVITRPEHLTDEVRDLLPELANENAVKYWKRVIRLAALCHDLGHLPFSHAAERELLPEGWDHERLSQEMINSMADLFRDPAEGTIEAEHIVKLALGEKKLPGAKFSRWESVLSEIIVGDSFGVDRMDYLLRDSHHAGVVYGRFDHYRLIDTLRLLPDPLGEPAVGIEHGGMHSAEALLIARYFMYTQVYYHPVRMIYDIHLIDFLREWLSEGKFSSQVDDHIAMTDETVLVGMAEAATDPGRPGHDPARRLVGRGHFKVAYSLLLPDARLDADVVETVYRAACEEFGGDKVRMKMGRDTNKTIDFPVQTSERVDLASNLSDVLQQLPVVASGYVYVERELLEKAKTWLATHRGEIIKPLRED